MSPIISPIHTYIIYTNIKPEKLVLDSNGYLRITDFGVAKKNKKDNQEKHQELLVIWHRSFNGQNHSFTVNFFAIGIMCYEFMIGKRPYILKIEEKLKIKFLSSKNH